MKVLSVNRSMLVRVLSVAGLVGALAAFAAPEEAKAACSAWSQSKNPGVTAYCSCGGQTGWSIYNQAERKLSASKNSTSYLVEVTALSSPTFNPITAEGTTQTAYTILPVNQNYHHCQIRVSN